MYPLSHNGRRRMNTVGLKPSMRARSQNKYSKSFRRAYGITWPRNSNASVHGPICLSRFARQAEKSPAIWYRPMTFTHGTTTGLGSFATRLLSCARPGWHIDARAKGLGGTPPAKRVKGYAVFKLHSRVRSFLCLRRTAPHCCGSSSICSDRQQDRRTNTAIPGAPIG
jgi:hypothetical protein